MPPRNISRSLVNRRINFKGNEPRDNSNPPGGYSDEFLPISALETKFIPTKTQDKDGQAGKDVLHWLGVERWNGLIVQEKSI